MASEIWLDDDKTFDKMKTDYKNHDKYVNKIKKAFTEQITKIFDDDDLWKHMKKPKNTYAHLSSYEFKYGKDKWSKNVEDVFTSEVKKNPVSRTFTIIAVGWGWSATYSNLNFIVDANGKHLFTAKDGQKENFDKEVRDQLKRIRSQKRISKFEGIGLFSLYINDVEKYVKTLTTKSNKKWFLVVDNIVNVKLKGYLAKNGYTNYRKNCMRKIIDV